MIAWRFSLARLFCMTAFAAIACAALARPTPFWLPTIVSVTVAFLFHAVLAAITVSAREEPFGAVWPLSAGDISCWCSSFSRHLTSICRSSLRNLLSSSTICGIPHPTKMIRTQFQRLSRRFPTRTSLRFPTTYPRTTRRIRTSQHAFHHRAVLALPIRHRASASSVNACGRSCSAARVV